MKVQALKPTPTPTAAPTPAAEPEPDVGAPSEAAKQTFAQTNTLFIEQADKCEVIWRAVTRALSNGDGSGSYERAQKGAEACSESSRRMAAIRWTEPISAPARKDLDARLTECRDAYLDRGLSLRSVAETVRDGMRPSSVAVSAEMMKIALTKTSVCQASYVATATAFGFDAGRIGRKFPFASL